MASERNRLLGLWRGRGGQWKCRKEMNHAKRSSTKPNTGTLVFSRATFIRMYWKLWLLRLSLHVWSNYTRRYISVNKVKAIVSLSQRCTITENRCRVYVISFSSSGRQKLGSSNGMMLLMWGQRRKVARCLSRKRWSNMFDSNPIAEAALYWLNRFNGALVQ